MSFSYFKSHFKKEIISEEINELYKKKYMKLKTRVKQFVHENAALSEQVIYIQERTKVVKEDRCYLLKKACQYESSRPGADLSELAATVGLPERLNTKYSSSYSSLNKSLARKRHAHEGVNNRYKKPSTHLKRKTLVPVPVDSSGLPVFPVNLGSLSVHSLGEIITDRLSFHDEDLIYPVGFCSTRVYGSLSDPTSPCIYTCMILDGGGSSPLFEIASDTDLETSISGDNIDKVHSELLRRINNVLGVEVVNTRGRGGDFFGISHPTVMNLLQSSPGIKKCVDYKMTKFEINRSGEPYVEENDASLTFDSLQRSITFTKSHMEEMNDQETLSSTTTLRSLLGNS